MAFRRKVRSKALETPFPDPNDSANRGDAAGSRHRRLGHGRHAPVQSSDATFHVPCPACTPMRGFALLIGDKRANPCHCVHALRCRKKATMQPNFLHTVAGENARVGVRDRYVRVTCVHTPLRAACSQSFIITAYIPRTSSPFFSRHHFSVSPHTRSATGAVLTTLLKSQISRSLAHASRPQLPPVSVIIR